MELHIRANHELRQPPAFSGNRQDPTMRPKQKIGNCTTWTENMTFEEWELDLKTWENVAKNEYEPNTLLHLLKESLKTTPNKKVKDFYENVIVKDGQSVTSWTKIFDRLKDKFGRDEDEDWDHFVIRSGELKWGENKAAEVWEEMEKIRLLRKKLTAEPVQGSNPEENKKVTEVLDKMLITKFLLQGKLEKKFEKAEIMKIEDEIKTKKYCWESAKKIIKEVKIKDDREKAQETHYGQHRSRDFRNQGNQRSRSESDSRSKSPNRYHSNTNSYSNNKNNRFPKQDNKQNGGYNKGNGSHKFKKNGPQKPLTNQQLSEMIVKMSNAQRYMQKDIRILMGKGENSNHDDNINSDLKLNKTHYTDGDDENDDVDDVYYEMEEYDEEPEDQHNVNYVKTVNGQKIDIHGFMNPQGQLVDFQGSPINLTGYVNNVSSVDKVNVFKKEIQVYYANNNRKGMTMDSGAPKNVTGNRWLREFIRENNVSKEKMNPRKVKEKFLFGSGDLYFADTQVDIPMRIMNGIGEMHVINMEACIVEADIPLLVGGEALEREGFALFFEKGENVCKLRRNNTVKGMNFPLLKTASGHYILSHILKS